MKTPNDLATAVAGLVGFMSGGPAGAAAGGVIGNLLTGGSIENSLQSGIASLMNATLGGKLGMGLNVMNAMSGGGGGNNFNPLLNAFSGVQQQMGVTPTANMQTQNKGGLPSLLNSIMPGLQNEKGGFAGDALGAAVFNTLLGRLGGDPSGLGAFELEQMRTGERNPSYRGTPVFAAQGGMIRGPGTGKSDSIPAAIYQNGGRVQEARLSDGEFVMTADAVKGAGGGDRAKGAAEMYKMMNRLERRA